MDEASPGAQNSRHMRRTGPERRQFPRYPQILDIQAQPLPRLDARPQLTHVVRGRMQNLSRGGLCLLTDDHLPARAVILCELAFPDLPVRVPALMKVCWTEKPGANGDGQLAGLQFVY